MEEIFELKSEVEWREAFACLAELRPELPLQEFLDRRESLLSRDYHLMGLTSGGQMVCVAGYVLQPHIERGSEFWLHDFATLPSERSNGFGLQMMRHLEEIAKSKGCRRLVLHTRAGRARAQNFYKNKAGYDEYAVVYKTEIAE